MLIVRSASKGVLGAFGFGIGYALGGVIITSVVCFGLGRWLTAVPDILSSLGAGILTCFIWPYMMILLPLVLTSLMSTTAIEPPKFFILVVITFATVIVCSVFIIALAAQISRLVSSPRSTMFLNRSLVVILVFGGGWTVQGAGRGFSCRWRKMPHICFSLRQRP
ncbi:MAG: threonine/homoserine/homoserine lactone efflux protein [Porticoccaceae bacterium]|jgi:threonine/homoserine/homoserine lactone efflux protein